MTPEQLTAASFAQYPPKARQFATEHLALLRQLPVAIAPAFLREMAGYDWHFPAERRTFERQCAWLEGLPAQERARLIAPFAAIRVPTELTGRDWVNQPQPFLEALTAYLWSSSQIDEYRRAAQELLAAPMDAGAQPMRTAFVVVGKDATLPRPQLFRKLAAHGVTLRNLQWTEETPKQLQMELRRRAPAATATEYSRWYIDGGEPWAYDAGEASLLSYTRLRPVRVNILERMNRFTKEGPGDAEAMRSMLEAIDPAACGAGEVTSDPLMQHFVTQLFVLGSGTQIYSTSFTQWAARETLRRAQPTELLVRFAPRQRQRTLNQLFQAATAVEVPDPEGSLVDADIGAYYVLLDMLRIADPAHITFLAWREGQGHAVIVSPRAAAGSVEDGALTLDEALTRYA